MKIYPISNTFRKYSKVILLAGGLTFAPPCAKAAKFLTDTCTVVQQTTKAAVTMIPREGSTDSLLLANAPSCDIVVQGIKKKAKIVVDVANHLLYKYSPEGLAEMVYPIATGKPSTPTHKGVRIVSNIEIPKKRQAPPHTNRYRNPAPYGARCIVLDRLDVKTGKRSSIGEFIHGNNDPESIGKSVSGGCMRMDEDAVVNLANDTKSGDIVIIK